MSWVLCNRRDRTPIVEWCLNDILHLNHYELNVNYQTIITCGGYFQRPNLVFISQSDPTRDELYHGEFRTLFHELRHYYQYMTKMFDFDFKAYTRDPKPEWSAMEIKMERYLDYLQYPWELDAGEFSMETTRQFFKTPLGQEYKPKPIPPFIPRTKDFVVNPTQADPSYPTFSAF